MEAPPFPLRRGDVFGPGGGNLRYHDGSNWRDSAELRRWQAALIGRWRRPRYRVTGRFDGLTQSGVRKVQAHLGRPRTGLIGPEEWAAVWGPPPVKPPPPPLSKEAKIAIKQKQKAYWDKISKYKVRYGSDPNAPQWYPGRPFYVHEHGPHVRRVQEILGTPTHGRYTLDLARRIAGYQRAMGLPISGIVDVRTAAMLDPPEQDETPA